MAKPSTSSNISSFVSEDIMGLWHNPIMFGFRRMFYVCSPEETTFGHLKDVPDYVNEAIPYFLVFVIVETIILALQDKWHAIFRVNDALSSLTAGVISLFPIDVLQQYMKKEVNFMWAAHQVHHSSEDYNYTTALRQSLLQRYSSWIFYLPMAFFIPPPIFLVHLQFNLIYQFWIHTQCIKTLGPLEWIINTPSHHRVHHGRNRYCINVNYAGTLIIWDKLFGTFTREKDDEVVIYGLVTLLNSWDPVYTQFRNWKHLLQAAWTMPGFLNKLLVFVNGPSWQPGRPRGALTSAIPDDYHVSVVFLAMMWYAPHSELIRCLTFLALEAYICGSNTCHQLMYIPHWIFFLSAGICTMLFMNGKDQQKKKME
ncbi:hypothetical protein LSH36_622g02013 [Paralvinella palmiformis]|uniref:Fatty acid hydroxylase domain-containing protein n=1 Tax=Paralvinella palmiformis TaxID=53620 RepID=A0AAD9J433_9ANNE|nr:hypothetical protein LSH36_622g02013 [Paralvinella palmiformis]